MITLGNTLKLLQTGGFDRNAVVRDHDEIFLILVIDKVLGIKPEEILNLLNPYTILGSYAAARSFTGSQEHPCGGNSRCI